MVFGHTAIFGRRTTVGYISRVKRLHLVGRVSAVLLLLLGFSIIFPIKIELSSSYALDRASEPTAGGNNTSTTTLTLNLSNNTLPLDLIPSSNGNFSTSSPASINVTTDHVTGYTLSIKAKVNNTNLINTEDSTKTISSIASALSSATFANASNTQYNNKWGYSPSKLNSANNTQYLPSPGYNTATVLNATASANSTADNYTITLGARVDNTLPVGTYEQVFTIVAIGNPVNYSITYNANDGANGANTTNMPSPNPQTGNASVDTTSIALSSATPERTGKAFKGWCTVTPTTNATTHIDECSGTVYQPEDNYQINQKGTNIIDLYAMWGPALVINFNGNGLYFDNDSIKTVNAVTYDATSETVSITNPQYSHTPNLGDDGVQPQDSNYTNNYTMNEMIHIPGAAKLHIRLTWGGEHVNYDWVAFWPGNHPSYTAKDDFASGVKCGSNTTGKYGGGNHTAASNTVECDIAGDIVTFAFRSDGSQVGDGYGYYAVVTGFDSNNNQITQGYNYAKDLVAGEYKTPATAGGEYRFIGWSENQNADPRVSTDVIYYTEGDISSYLQKTNADSAVTLYAIWQKIYVITYNGNGATGSVTTQTQEIIAGATANLKAAQTSSGFTRTNYKVKEWNTSANGNGASYAGGASFTAPANMNLGDSLTLYAIWVPVYTVQYDGNNADNPNGMGTINASGIRGVRHYNVAENDTFYLFASNYKRDGYGFVGWSTDSDAWAKLTDNNNNNDPTIYGHNELFKLTSSIIALKNDKDIVTLYAIWAPAEKDGNNNPIYLQDWAGCDDMTATIYNSFTSTFTVSKDTITALTDKRDNMVYTIAKLADGNCWMIENLRLVNTATTGNNVNNTSITNESLAQGYGGVFHGLAGTESANFADSTTPNSLYTTDTSSTTHNIITGSNLGYRLPRYFNSIANMPSTLSNTQSVTSVDAYTSFSYHIYSYGNYYTWAAAIADTSDYATSNGHAKVETSICPTGWHLPYGGNGNTEANPGNTSGGFYYLANQMTATSSNKDSANKIRAFPNNFVSAGYYSTSLSNRGSSGHYWSSSAGSNTGAYYLSFYNTSLSVASHTSKFNGYSVRCVRYSKTINDITYMQEFATLSSSDLAQVKSSMAVGQQYELMDNRDNKTYTVAKLADGNIWMTQNLDHDIVTTTGFYTSANTDIPSTWTASTATSNTNSWSGSIRYPESYNPGDLCWDGVLLSNPANNVQDILTSCGTDRHYHIGNYYNWTAAVAMNDSNSYATDGTDVDQSICPAGWRIPNNDTNGTKTFDHLVNQLNLAPGSSGNMQNAPVYFAYGGDMLWGGFGYGGYYWTTSTMHFNEGASVFSFNIGQTSYSPNGMDRDSGLFVRCVAR